MKNQIEAHETSVPRRRWIRLALATFAGLAVATLLLPYALHADHPAAGTHLYLDVHRLGAGNVTAAAVAEAHEKDLAIEGELGVDYQKYWVDEASGRVFCLVRAPSAEAAAEVHRRAHGLVADEIHEVQAGQ